MQSPSLEPQLRRLGIGDWLASARSFARALREAGERPGRLLVVGAPDEEPWHLTAHLADAARFGRAPQLEPTLVRWQPPADAPAHLRVGLDALREHGPRTRVLVATGSAPPDALLDRLDDARGRGAALFALHPDSLELEGLAHESLRLPRLPVGLGAEPLDVATHVLGDAAAASSRRPRLRVLLGR